MLAGEALGRSLNVPAARLANAAGSGEVLDTLRAAGFSTLKGIRAFGAGNPLRFTYPVAGKTGTSSNFRDSLAVGYTDRYTVAEPGWPYEASWALEPGEHEVQVRVGDRASDPVRFRVRG